MTRLAIIGAGLSGLVLANELRDRAGITVFEKSRGVGGRMSTRYRDAYSFDHGAQYFRAKTGAFRTFLEPHIASGLVAPWRPRLVNLRHGKRPEPRPDNGDTYIAAPRMTSLCKALSVGVSVENGREINAIERTKEGWRLNGPDASATETFDWVVSTAPPPQTCRILPYKFAHRAAVETARMSGCFALLLGYVNPPITEWDAASVIESPIGWISVNSSKSGRPDGFSLVVQSTNGWADDNLESPTEEIIEHLMRELTALTGSDMSNPQYQSLHQWRFANTPIPSGMPFFLDVTNKLAVCGDWCIQGRVEAAFTSARLLASSIASRLG